MSREQLNDLSVFVEVARRGGFRAAAKSLGLGAASVSQSVQRFEDRLGVRLIERTTRNMSLTMSGRTLYERCDSSISDIEAALRNVDEAGDTVSGVLRLTAPETAGPLFLNELVSKFLAAHPEAKVDISYDDRKVDLVTQGLDAAIRSRSLLEQDTYTAAVGPQLEMAVVVAPSYLEEHGRLKSPTELSSHDGVCFRFINSGQLAPWMFSDGKEPYEVAPRPRAVVNDVDAVLKLATEGVGIAYVYERLARPLIREGQLKRLFKAQTVTLPRYTINYLSKRNMPSRLRAFLNVAKAMPKTVGKLSMPAS